jgi:hypothetical protein
MPAGRPSSYNEGVAKFICDAIADGEALHVICKLRGAPSMQTVYRWIENYPEFRDSYARAREIQQDRAVDEIIEIADNDLDPQRARNRIDARKWRAAKLAPKKYGERLDMNVQALVRTISDEELNARLAQLLGKAGSAALAGRAGAPQIEGQVEHLPALSEAT